MDFPIKVNIPMRAPTNPAHTGAGCGGVRDSGAGAQRRRPRAGTLGNFLLREIELRLLRRTISVSARGSSYRIQLNTRRPHLLIL